MSSPMRPLVRMGHQPHPIDRKRYGQPRLGVYYASRALGWARPGVYLWVLRRHLRVVPLPKRSRS